MPQGVQCSAMSNFMLCKHVGATPNIIAVSFSVAIGSEVSATKHHNGFATQGELEVIILPLSKVCMKMNGMFWTMSKCVVSYVCSV